MGMKEVEVEDVGRRSSYLNFREGAEILWTVNERTFKLATDTFHLLIRSNRYASTSDRRGGMEYHNPMNANRDHDAYVLLKTLRRALVSKVSDVAECHHCVSVSPNPFKDEVLLARQI